MCSGVDMSQWREQFSVFRKRPEWAYFDNAASCQVPDPVLDTMLEYQRELHANVHRGSYQQSQHATALFESWRAQIAGFIGASADTLIFTRGTTESMNVLAESLLRPRLKAGDNVVVTLSEHHANWLPWQRVCEQVGAEFRVAGLNAAGQVEDIFAHVDSRTRLVALNHASNVMGVINPVAEICAKLRQQGVLSVVDAAQSAAQLNLDVSQLQCDALAFSGHKLYGPTGIGALYVRADVLDTMPPYQVGGGMVDMVYADHSTFHRGVQGFEAGTPNLVGAAGLAAAVEFIQGCRAKGSSAYLRALFGQLKDTIERFEWLTCLPHSDGVVPVLSVHNPDIHPRDLAVFLDQDGVSARAGRHCAQPLINKLTANGCLRFSLGVHSNAADIQRLAEGLEAWQREHKGQRQHKGQREQS
ncbi:cysteine desulfurase CsdA [Aliidiomarina maris]|uniref:Probable cysteine desulfurase n=2 Tax=Aliidiomarina maris TaxID=531312 RepID=A0A327X7H1_9GAMM|nr:cysteine desulfurase/selenocysteine lyase [Aliidiomarina maris]RUO28642.1 cysteine desulfurase CsdA [Aliidiomarina maris]